MRILFFSYPSSFQNVGGGEILLLKTKEYLEKLGVQVKLFDIWQDKVEEFDLLHVFGSVKDCLGLMRAAHDRGVKVVVTPIIWSSWRRAFFTFGSYREKADLVLRHALKVACPWFPSSRRQMLLLADLVLSNSKMEQEHIRRLFAIPERKMKVVYSGADRQFLKSNPAFFQAQYGKKPFILSVGRIEPRKNQLNLIRAVKVIHKKLILIGSPVSGFEAYFERCQKEGAGFTTFIPTLNHQEGMLGSAYAACELCVVPGWFETPGLAALEAVLAGAKVTVTKIGSAREYFGNSVEYFDPSHPADIVKGILAGLKRPRTDSLRNAVLARFTWEAVAQSTREAYQGLIRG